MSIEIKLDNIRGLSEGVPKLTLSFSVENTSEATLSIISVAAEVRVAGAMIVHDMAKSSYFMGYATLESDSGQLSSRSKQYWILGLPMEAYALRKAEEVRKGADLFLQIQFFCRGGRMVGSTPSPIMGVERIEVQVSGYGTHYCPFKWAQSDWEKTLQELGYRELAKGEEEIQRASDRAQGAIREIESILDKAKGAASLVGVARHATYFEVEASGHRRASLLWFFGAVTLAALGVWYSVFSFHPGIAIPADSSGAWWPHLAYMTSRLLVLSVIFFGLAWTARNYRASKHNEIVNRHRQNALKTFETFAMAADDKDTKDAVLLEATKSIFQAQSSGYLVGEPEKIPSSTVIEVLRKAMSKEGPS